MSKGRLFLIALYALVLLVGVGLIIGGGSILWANTFMKDADGFYTTRSVEVQRDSHAITSYPADIDIDSLPVLNWLKSIEVKVTANNNQDKGVFVGIAPEDDLKNYLSGVHHDQIDEMDLNHPIGKPKIEYKNFPGTSTPASPTDKDFWEASSSGTGEQILKWGIESGTYSVVLMNQDGSSGIDLNASVGANVPIASGIGLGLTVAGLILILLSFFLLYVTVTRSRI
mgnify:FL=1